MAAHREREKTLKKRLGLGRFASSTREGPDLKTFLFPGRSLLGGARGEGRNPVPPPPRMQSGSA